MAQKIDSNSGVVTSLSNRIKASVEELKLNTVGGIGNDNTPVKGHCITTYDENANLLQSYVDKAKSNMEAVNQIALQFDMQDILLKTSMNMIGGKKNGK